ncbi:BORE2 protein, partial [Crypturellus undulatus]|nr:BORE2 protein [Crypturellus undulatus]
MALRRPPGSGKRRSTDSGVEPDRGALSREKKEQRVALFLSDFDQQAKENIQEMKKELDALLQTAEKAFAVELLKMPVAIRKMKRKDLLSKCLRWGDACEQGNARALPKQKVFILLVCLLVKVTTIVEYEDAKHISAKKISKKVSLLQTNNMT